MLTIEIKEKKSRLIAEGSDDMPDRDVLKEIQEKLSYVDQAATQQLWQVNKIAMRRKTQVYAKLFSLKTKIFYTGLLPYVIHILNEHKFEYKLNDLRDVIDVGTAELDIDLTNKTVWPFQQIAAERVLKHKKGIIAIATGLGKTFTAGYTISLIKHLPVVFVVRRVDLMYQTVENFEKFFNKPIGIVGDGVKRLHDINVVCAPSVVNEIRDNPDGEISQLIKNAKVLFIDESHCARAGTIKEIIMHSEAQYRIGLSATPFRESEDGGHSDDLLIEGLLGQKLITVRAKHIFQKGWDYLVKPSIHFIKVPKDDFDDTKKTYQYVFKHFVVNNEKRTMMIAAAALRLRALNRTTLILTKEINQIDALEKLIPNAYIIKGDVSVDMRKEILDKARRKEIDMIIATDKIAEEGLDLPSLDALIFTAPSKSKIKSVQAVGRVIRKFRDPSTGKLKDSAIVLNFYESDVKFLSKHAKKRHSILSSEFGDDCITLHKNLLFLDEYKPL